MHPVVHLLQSQFFLPASAFWLLTSGFCLLPGADTQDWPLARGNIGMTGTCPTTLRFPLELAWTSKIGDKRGDGVVATPVVKAGKVFIGGQSGRFSCLDLASGKEIWKVDKKGGSFEGHAAFAGDLVIAGCGDGFVYAWNVSDGKEAWSFETQGEIHAGANPWTGPDGKQFILIGSYDNNLYCLDALTGKKAWNFETANYVNGAAAIFDGKTAFGGCDGTLYILDMLTGKEEKKVEIGNYMGNNIAADKGVAYLAHYGNKVEAFALTDGARLWQFGERDFPFYAAPALNAQWVIAGSRDKRVYGLDRMKGESKWIFRTQDDVDSSPLICADQHVIFGCNDGFFYGIDLSKGEEVWRYEIGAPVKASPAVAGDFILIGADDGSVYAFKNGKAPAAK